MDLEKLCLKLAKSDDGDDVVSILKEDGIWDDDKYWHLVGAQDISDQFLNNHSTIGSQQSNPANALVEKLVNCGDSALMLECRLRDIDPRGPSAPKNVRSATEKIFDIEQGRWINAQNQRKREIAEKYCNLVCTGLKGTKINPTYTIFDFAEGQDPKEFKTTFMSLTKVNKVEIPFVQGKHGMGSFGAINFCEKHGLQLIISKKHPKLADQDNKWGFTIVRRVPPDSSLGSTETYRSSRWVYLVLDNEVPSFSSESLKILPGKYPEPYEEKMKYGTFIKLYNYDIGSGLRTSAILDLNNKINQLLVNPLVPIRIYERRKGFKANSYETTCDGLETRFDRDRSELLVDGFPSEFIFNCNNQPFRAKIFAYKKYSDLENRKKTDVKKYGNGVIFTTNGQTNGHLPYRFFATRGLTYENIMKNLLVQIDCSDVAPSVIEKIFQNDRERIYDNEITAEIKAQIVEELKKHQGLKKFQSEWRSSEIADYEKDEKTTELFNKLLRRNPNIMNFLTGGARIEDPINRGRKEVSFESSYFPSYFKTKKEYTSEKPRELEEEREARISLVTDAPNDYFTRYREPGSFTISYGDEDITQNDGVRLSGYNGKWILTLPPRNEKLQQYKIEINDANRVEPLVTDLNIILIPKVDHPSSESNPRKNTSVNIDPPSIIPVTKDKWDDYDFDGRDVMKIEQNDEDYSYFLNMDNLFILNYLKTLKDSEIDLAKKQYELAMSLIGLMVVHDFKEQENKNADNEQTLGEFSKKYTRTLGPVLMSIIREVNRSLDD